MTRASDVPVGVPWFSDHLLLERLDFWPDHLRHKGQSYWQGRIPVRIWPWREKQTQGGHTAMDYEMGELLCEEYPYDGPDK